MERVDLFLVRVYRYMVASTAYLFRHRKMLIPPSFLLLSPPFTFDVNVKSPAACHQGHMQCNLSSSVDGPRRLDPLSLSASVSPPTHIHSTNSEEEERYGKRSSSGWREFSPESWQGRGTLSLESFLEDHLLLGLLVQFYTIAHSNVVHSIVLGYYAVRYVIMSHSMRHFTTSLHIAGGLLGTTHVQ